MKEADARKLPSPREVAANDSEDGADVVAGIKKDLESEEEVKSAAEDLRRV